MTRGWRMKSLRVFNEREWQYVLDCLEVTERFKPKEARTARANLRMLLQLAKSVSLCQISGQ